MCLNPNRQPCATYRIRERDDVDPFLQQFLCHVMRQPGIPKHDGHNGVGPALNAEPCGLHLRAEVRGVALQLVAQLR